MNLKIRRTIFYALIVIFFVFAFFIIPYSNGWRFDFTTFSFVKLGGLYIETDPAETQIQIDKLNFQIKSGFIKSGLLVANLFPKTYHVSASKDGYQSWNKNVTVKPSLVTQIHQVILLPQEWSKELLEENVKNFYPGSNYLAWQDNVGKLKIENKTIKGTDFVAWMSGEKSALIYDKATKSYFVINPTQNNTASNINLIFNNAKEQKEINDSGTIKQILPHPSDKNKLIFTTNEFVYLLDFNKPSLDIIKSGQFNLLKAFKNEIFISNSSNLYSYNLDSKELTTIYKSPEVSSVEISDDNHYIAINASKKLILLDRSQKENNVLELSENPINFVFSPDSKKIVAINTAGDIKIFFIGDDYELYNKKPYSYSLFKIKNIDLTYKPIWHQNSSYIFLKTQDDFRLLEIDDSAPINFNAINVSAEKYYYNQKINQIYIIQNQKLYKLTK